MTDSSRMKILLVDDHEPIRRNIRQLIELQTDYQVVGEGATGLDAVERVESLHPDLVLMDMNMPGMSGPEATKVIKERYPEIKVLALTAFADMTLVAEMVKAGASGYLLKGGPTTELLKSIDAVARGHAALDSEVTKGVMDDMAVLYKKEQERADALAELDRMKSEFISVVSHELRTPLTAIKGNTATLRRGWSAVDDEIREQMLGSIADQCDRLTSMISQIMTVSGIQRGGLGLNPTTFSLGDLARDSVKALASKTTGRNVYLHLQDANASGDRERIKEVAVAIIENAIQFTTGDITIRTMVEGAQCKLNVEDEGPGLSEEVLQSLLQEPFRQGDSSNTRKVGGLGLSLYLARQVLEASDGRLEVETDPYGGSTFTMVLPLAD